MLPSPGDLAVDVVSALPMELRHRLLARRLWLLREIDRDPDSPYSLEPLIQSRSIFFHIPKAAGLSVSEALYACRGAGHATVATARLLFGRDNFAGFFKFCFVRNPWNRLVSAYHYLHEGGIDRTVTPWIERHIRGAGSFADFFDYLADNPGIMTDQHLMPQYRFITDFSGRLQVDFIGRFEDIERDFAEISKRLGILASLPKSNKSDRGDFRNYYDSRTAEIVGRIYARDIELLDHAFEASRP